MQISLAWNGGDTDSLTDTILDTFVYTAYAYVRKMSTYV